MAEFSKKPIETHNQQLKNVQDEVNKESLGDEIWKGTIYYFISS